MLFETAAIGAVVIFGVLVFYAVRTLSQLQRTLEEAEQVLAVVRREANPLITEVRGAVEEIHRLSAEARQGGQKVGIFFDAIQQVGGQINDVRSAFNHTSGSLLGNVSSLLSMGGLLSGVKAASSAIRRRFYNHGGRTNGR